MLPATGCERTIASPDARESDAAAAAAGATAVGGGGGSCDVTAIR